MPLKSLPVKNWQLALFSSAEKWRWDVPIALAANAPLIRFRYGSLIPTKSTKKDNVDLTKNWPVNQIQTPYVRIRWATIAYQSFCCLIWSLCAHRLSCAALLLLLSTGMKSAKSPQVHWSPFPVITQNPHISDLLAAAFEVNLETPRRNMCSYRLWRFRTRWLFWPRKIVQRSWPADKAVCTVSIPNKPRDCEKSLQDPQVCGTNLRRRLGNEPTDL